MSVETGICIHRDFFLNDLQILCRGCPAILGHIPNDDFRMVENLCLCDPGGPEPCVYGSDGHGEYSEYTGGDVSIAPTCPDCGASTDCDGEFELDLEDAEPGLAPPESARYRYSAEDGELFIISPIKDSH